MKKIKTVPWDAAEFLETEEDIIGYLNAVLEENDEALLRAEIDGETVWQKKLRFVRPAEMISVTLPGTLLDERKVTFHLQNTEEAK